MAQRNVSSFKTTKDSRFADNSTGQIEEVDHRDMYEDVADSFLNKTDGGTVVGNVGIGAAPSFTLDAQSSTTTVKVRAHTSAASEAGFIVERTVNTPTKWEIYSPIGSTQLRFYNSGDKLFLSSDGKLGIGQTPTAVLHLKAGTAAANTAPLKLTTGTALVTPEDGALEYHSSHLYFTIGSTRYQLDQQVSSTLASGTFTPTFTSNTNLDSTPVATALTSKYIRVGDMVTVTMYVNVDPTASGQYIFYATIPIASNFSAANDLTGLGSSGDSTGHRCSVTADTTNDRATITGTSTGTTTASLYITYMYKVM